MPVEFELPHDLPDGEYQFIVSDWTRYLEDERTANPFKFNADNIGELFTVMRDVLGIRHDAMYLRLVRQADGVAVGHTAMPHLPASRRQVLLDSGRSDITPFVTSTVKIVPTGLVMSGSAEFTITCEASRESGRHPRRRNQEKQRVGKKVDASKMSIQRRQDKCGESEVYGECLVMRLMSSCRDRSCWRPPGRSPGAGGDDLALGAGQRGRFQGGNTAQCGRHQSGRCEALARGEQ